MQNKLLRFGSIVIFFLAIIFFIIAGSVDDIFAIFGGSSFGTLAKYKGTPVGIQNETFNNIRENYARYAQMSQNKNMNSDENRPNLYYQAMGLTIMNMAAAEKIEDAGFIPSADLINDMIKPLRTSGLPFSKEVYGEGTAEYTRDRSILFNNIKDLLMNNRYMRDIYGQNAALDAGIFAVSAASTKSGLSYFDLTQYYVLQRIFQNASTVTYGLKESPEEAKFLAEMGADKRSFDAVAFDTSSYPRSETKKFGEEHKDLFTKYDLSVLTYEEKGDAEDALKLIQNGEKTFEDAYVESELHSYAGSQGKSNLSYKYQLKLAIEDDSELESVVSLKKDEFSKIVKTSTGYSFFRCDGEKTEADFSKDDILDTVSTYISSNERTLIEDYYVAQAKAFTEAVKQSGFAAACRKFGLEKLSIPAFPLNYRDSSVFDRMTSDINQIASGSRDENFLKAAFGLKKPGDISEPLILGYNVIVLSLAGAQKDSVTEEKLNSIKTTLASYDQTNSYNALMSGENVENTFYDGYEQIEKGRR